MAGMGPPPKSATARTRGIGVSLTMLPAEGRTGRIPPWPIGRVDDGLADAERALWRELWRMPQAVLWEQQRLFRIVAQYVRWKVAAEFGNVVAGREARQYEDRLLLSPLAMVRARVRIAPDEVAERRDQVSAGQESDDDLTRRRRLAQRRQGTG